MRAAHTFHSYPPQTHPQEGFPVPCMPTRQWDLQSRVNSKNGIFQFLGVHQEFEATGAASGSFLCHCSHSYLLYLYSKPLFVVPQSRLVRYLYRGCWVR